LLLPGGSDREEYSMPVAFVFESDRVGQSEYDELMRAIGRETLDAPNPAGFIAHLAGPKPSGGWRVIDLWESEDAANNFYNSEQFRPVAAGAANFGINTTPWPLHRVEVDQTIKHVG
jgi:heme-degrading monooxygenase HmoA